MSAIFCLGWNPDLAAWRLAGVASAFIRRFLLPHRSGYLYRVMAIFIGLVEALIVLGTGFP